MIEGTPVHSIKEFVENVERDYRDRDTKQVPWFRGEPSQSFPERGETDKWLFVVEARGGD